jgi:hypothetical protein
MPSDLAQLLIPADRYQNLVPQLAEAKRAARKIHREAAFAHFKEVRSLLPCRQKPRPAPSGVTAASRLPPDARKRTRRDTTEASSLRRRTDRSRGARACWSAAAACWSAAAACWSAAAARSRGARASRGARPSLRRLSRSRRPSASRHSWPSSRHLCRCLQPRPRAKRSGVCWSQGHARAVVFGRRCETRRGTSRRRSTPCAAPNPMVRPSRVDGTEPRGALLAVVCSCWLLPVGALDPPHARGPVLFASAEALGAARGAALGAHARGCAPPRAGGAGAWRVCRGGVGRACGPSSGADDARLLDERRLGSARHPPPAARRTLSSRLHHRMWRACLASNAGGRAQVD